MTKSQSVDGKTITFSVNTSTALQTDCGQISIPVRINADGIVVMKYASWSVVVQGEQGEQGNPGTNGTNGINGATISTQTDQYYLSTSNTTLSGDTWHDGDPSTIPTGKYLWTRVKNTMTDNSIVYSDAVHRSTLEGVITDVNKANKSITDKVWQTDITSSINTYDGTTASAIRDRVTQTETDISGITSRVSDVETTVSDDLGPRMTAAESNITQTADKIDATVTVTRDGETHETSITLSEEMLEAVTDQFVVKDPTGSTTIIEGGNIKANSLTADTLSANSVTSAAISANAVTADKIHANAVTADKINAGAVTASKLDTDAITSTNYSAPTSATTPFSVAGSKFDLANGKITTPAFSVDENGNAKVGNATNYLQFNGSTGQLSANVTSLSIGGNTAATQGYADGKASDAQSAAISAAASDATSKANAAQSAAISAAAADATTKANNAAKTATNYLYYSANKGLVIHDGSETVTTDTNVDSLENGNVRITSGGMDIYRGSDQMAHYGEEVIIGPDGIPYTEINTVSSYTATEYKNDVRYYKVLTVPNDRRITRCVSSVDTQNELNWYMDNSRGLWVEDFHVIYYTETITPSNIRINTNGFQYNNNGDEAFYVGVEQRVTETSDQSYQNTQEPDDDDIVHVGSYIFVGNIFFMDESEKPSHVIAVQRSNEDPKCDLMLDTYLTETEDDYTLQLWALPQNDNEIIIANYCNGTVEVDGITYYELPWYMIWFREGHDNIGAKRGYVYIKYDYYPEEHGDRRKIYTSIYGDGLIDLDTNEDIPSDVMLSAASYTYNFSDGYMDKVVAHSGETYYKIYVVPNNVIVKSVVKTGSKELVAWYIDEDRGLWAADYRVVYAIAYVGSTSTPFFVFGPNTYSNNEPAGAYSFAAGNHCSAQGAYQTVLGQYNVRDNSSAFIIGNGNDVYRSNAFTVDWYGNAKSYGSLYSQNDVITQGDIDNYVFRKVNITFNANGGLVVHSSGPYMYTGATTITVAEETKVTSSMFPNVTHESGYTFLGWYTAAEEGVKVTELYAYYDTTLYAHWDQNS